MTYMGKTSDGVSASDWDRVHELAVAIVNAEVDSSEEETYRKMLLRYLDELTQKYGELPSLLATRADYVDDLAETERLLLHASELAMQIGDTRNACEVALGLRPVAARAWLEKARAFMAPDDQSRWAESRRIERKLDEL